MLPLTVQAQSPGDRDLLRQGQERLLEEQRHRLEQLQRAPALAPAPSGVTLIDERCFEIERINVSGASLLTERTRTKRLAPFEHRCLKTTDIDAVLRTLTDHYLDRGYITTRAYLPEQDLTSGVLEIQIIEGQLEELVPRLESGLSARELKTAFPGKEGEQLNLREIEQLLDQLNRLPSRQASVALEPGEHPGGSRAVIANLADKAWRVSLSRHNNGQSSTGKHLLEAGLEWDTPLGLNDALALRLGKSLYHDSTRQNKNIAFQYSVPWGWWTAAYRFYGSDYDSVFTNGSFRFKTSGESHAHDLRLERVMHRDNLSKTLLSGALNTTETKNKLEDITLNSSVRLTELGLSLGHGRRLGPAFINLDLGWQRGMGWLGAARDQHPAKGEAHAQYNKYTATASFLQPFTILKHPLSLESVAFWQKSRDVLYSPRQVGLGGLYSVRGFKDQTLYGDTGGYWRTQLRWDKALTWTWLQPVFNRVSVAVGWDLGLIKRTNENEADGQHGRLAGHALELTAQGRYARASLVLAKSEKRPAAFERHEEPFYFRLDLTY
ncbi:MAG: ShlB/FhaC/HecB family hemolysin secretion/activation protein [Azoarcus sp.]|jgi:hemolysin activation/secretion protein|nr:ShlB/FhaC/HecB family hemolysin secretion/activation protein [Azoarcus sp.]